MAELLTIERRRSRIALTVGFVAAVTVFLAVTKGPVFHARVDRGPLNGVDFIDDGWTQSVFVLVYLLAIGAFALHRGERLPGRLVACMVAPAVALLVAVVWSPYRERAFEQAAMMLLGTLAALAIGTMLRPRALLWALWTAMAAGLVVSFWADTRDWPFSRDVNGDLTGVYFNTNSFGAVGIMAALASAALILASFDQRAAAARWAMIVAGVVGVVVGAVIVAPIAALTPVVGAIAAVAVVAAVAGLRRRRNQHRPLHVSVWAWLVAAVVTVGLIGGAVVEVHDGRLSTVSDRFEIWTVVWRFIRDRPIVGWGLMSAWLDTDMSIQIQSYGGRVVKESHNGFLEVAMGGGAIALLSLLLAVVIAVREAFRSAARSHTWVSLWPLAAVVYCVVVNLGETYIGANLLPWTLLVAATASASRADREAVTS
jgi:O-antigen ligase